MKIFYNNNTKEKILPLKKLIKASLTEVLREEECYKNVEVSVSFVCDDEIRKLNKEYRAKDKSTDVLSFPMIEYEKNKFFKDLDKDEIKVLKNECIDKINLGDIVVSIETIRRQAKEFHNTFEKELCLMVIHSMLHLMGYDHMIKKEEKVMFKKQEDILKSVFKNLK